MAVVMSSLVASNARSTGAGGEVGSVSELEGWAFDDSILAAPAGHLDYHQDLEQDFDISAALGSPDQRPATSIEHLDTPLGLEALNFGWPDDTFDFALDFGYDLSLDGNQATATRPVNPATKEPPVEKDHAQSSLEDAAVRHTCRVCGEAFAKRKSLNSHIKATQHSTKHECETCHKTFTRLDSLRRHTAEQHEDGDTEKTKFRAGKRQGKVACPRCGVKVRSSGLTEHQASKTCQGTDVRQTADGAAVLDLSMRDNNIRQASDRMREDSVMGRDLVRSYSQELVAADLEVFLGRTWSSLNGLKRNIDDHLERGSDLLSKHWSSEVLQPWKDIYNYIQRKALLDLYYPLGDSDVKSVMLHQSGMANVIRQHLTSFDMRFKALCERHEQSAQTAYSRRLQFERIAERFRSAVMDGRWADAESCLFGFENSESYEAVLDPMSKCLEHGIVAMTEPVTAGDSQLKFLIRRQKYLELLENRDWSAALTVLRNELTPLKSAVCTERIRELSSFMMCTSPEDLRLEAAWDGADGKSRDLLVTEVLVEVGPPTVTAFESHAVPERLAEDRMRRNGLSPSVSSPAVDLAACNGTNHTAGLNRMRSEAPEDDWQMLDFGIGSIPD